MKFYLSFIALVISISIHAQLLTWSPAFPKDQDVIKITVDATRGNKGLLDYKENVYVHIGLITSASRNATDWKYAPFTWGGTATASQAVAIGNNKWQFTINNIRRFFNVPSNESIKNIAILFRAGGCSNCAAQRNADGSDMYIPVYDEGLYVKFEKPGFQPFIIPAPDPLKVIVGDFIDVKMVSSKLSSMELQVNGQTVFSEINTDSISGRFNFSLPGNYTITGTANTGNQVARDSFSFIVSGSIVFKPLPEGIKPGINREAGDTSIVLALVAPNKTKVSVIGDFPGSDWKDNTQYQMNLAPDNRTWWIRITGLNPTIEYGFQYLVDGTLRVTDPYVEKILDPVNDAFISPATYPNLKAYPTGKTSGIVGVIKPRSDYKWKNKFSRPDPSQLVIYEVLLRDFLENHDFNTLTDTLSYLQRLGINAIELMPVSEFEGNLSWGYNPNFFFALDKYYGNENSFKRFIDSCHGKGIAVIMDIVLNHATGTCPLAALYWDGINQRPSADNPWFNVTARHPFNVFNDFNHESKDTRYFTTRVIEYWLKEYNIDGYRFDLSKGFTQKNNPNDVNAFGAYDASRIAIWKEYHDSLQLYSRGAYTILEHFADNSEEKVLSDYGILLWGNSNYNYNEGTMGYVNSSDVSWSLSQERNWSKSLLISYMESHDEERLMYKNGQFGNIQGIYNTRDKNTALERMKLAATLFLMTPGPRLIWQFGELGFDYSINRCINGTVNNNCRLDNKPIVWDYVKDASRKSVYDWYSRLLKLRSTLQWKNASRVISYNLIGAYKWVGFNANEDLNLVAFGNFDVKPITVTLQFPKAGTWIDLMTGKSITINTPVITNSILQPGEYHVYTDKSAEIITSDKDINTPLAYNAEIFPNPSKGNSTLLISVNKLDEIGIEVTGLNGQSVLYIPQQKYTVGKYLVELPTLNESGTYIIKVKGTSGIKNLKWVVVR